MFSFPPLFRLRKSSSFREVQANGRRIFSKDFTIIVKRSGAERSRIGITVSRKVDKRAVKRNRLKRCLREIFRLHWWQLREPLDIVIIAKKSALECSLGEMRKQILGALRRHNYLNVTDKIRSK